MKRICSALLACLSFAQPAIGDDRIIVWSNTAGWMVAADTTLGNACFLATVFDNGITLRVGFQPKGSKFPAYVAIGSNDWKSIEEGKEYRLQIQLDGNSPWDAPATGINFNGTPALIVNFSETRFITEFMRQHSFRATFNGTQIAHLSLKGSALASRELGRCQEAVNQMDNPKITPKDPFTVNETVDQKKDPFSL